MDKSVGIIVVPIIWVAEFERFKKDANYTSLNSGVAEGYIFVYKKGVFWKLKPEQCERGKKVEVPAISVKEFEQLKGDANQILLNSDVADNDIFVYREGTVFKLNRSKVND